MSIKRRNQCRCKEDTRPSNLIKNEDYWYMNKADSLEYLLQTRVLIILRGLPGSGKSTLAEKICRLYPVHVLASADHYFLRYCPGSSMPQYKFNKSELKYAHMMCQQDVETAMNLNVRTIIIDNTNIRWSREIEPYVQLARKYGYYIIFAETTTPWAFCPIHLATRNMHNVSQSCITQFLKWFCPIRYKYWALFFNEKQCSSLNQIANQFAVMSVAFKKQLNNNNVSGTNQAKAERLILHCTLCFIPDLGDKWNCYKDRFFENQGRIYDLLIVGLLFTDKCWSARVKVPVEHRLNDLWFNTSYFNKNGRCKGNTYCHPTCDDTGYAHITLWTDYGISNVCTGSAMINLIRLECDNKFGQIYESVLITKWNDKLTHMPVQIIQERSTVAIYFENPLTISGILGPAV
ncbi:hypothetical protein GJ496_006170 [Pomphorhynchus laevis]|nr:hypothetical protein GJ496_006170 [Pomphorhynchus laevis]